MKTTATLVMSLVALMMVSVSQGAIVSLSETGTNYMPAAAVVDGFAEGSIISPDRTHTIKRAMQGDASVDSRLLFGYDPFNSSNPAWPTGASACQWASYLDGGQQVQIRWNNRSVADYTLTINVDTPSYAYVLMDNRILDNVNTNDPDLSGALTWLADWTRMETGICPDGGNTKDWLGIDESNNGPLNQAYAVYRKRFGASVTTGAQNQSANMYTVIVQQVPEPTTFVLLGCGAVGLVLVGRRYSRKSA